LKVERYKSSEGRVSVKFLPGLSSHVTLYRQ